jgi:flagellar hook-associated protein 3 FlgL
MTAMGLGDLARFATGTRTNASLRTQLATLSAELSSGRHADPARAIGADLSRLAGLDHQTARGEAFVTAARQAAQTLSATQVSLTQIAGTQSALTERLMTLPVSATDQIISQNADAARAAFRDMVGQMNTTLAGTPLFAGAAGQGPALAPADAMLAALETAAAGATTAAQVAAAVDAWFAPGGGFDMSGYQGDTGAPPTRTIDGGETVTLSARADGPALRGALRSAALAALAGAGSLALTATERTGTLIAARANLLSNATDLTSLQADLGRAEEQVDTALARHTARATAWGIMQTDLQSVDPYVTASRLKEVEAQLDTHLTLTARLSQLTLTRYLR